MDPQKPDFIALVAWPSGHGIFIIFAGLKHPPTGGGAPRSMAFSHGIFVIFAGLKHPPTGGIQYITVNAGCSMAFRPWRKSMENPYEYAGVSEAKAPAYGVLCCGVGSDLDRRALIHLNGNLISSNIRYMLGIRTKVTMVAYITAKPSAMAMGTTIRACMLVSNMIGNTPTKVVIEVNVIALKRAQPASSTACFI